MHGFKIRSVFRLTLLCTILLGFSLPAIGQGDLFITNATILTGTGETIENGSILIRNGKIAQIGANLRAPSGVERIDADGQYVMAGIIDAHSHLAAQGIKARSSLRKNP